MDSFTSPTKKRKLLEDKAFFGTDFEDNLPHFTINTTSGRQTIPNIMAKSVTLQPSNKGSQLTNALQKNELKRSISLVIDSPPILESPEAKPEVKIVKLNDDIKQAPKRKRSLPTRRVAQKKKKLSSSQKQTCVIEISEDESLPLSDSSTENGTACESKVVLIFPLEGSKDKVTLTEEDLTRLEPEAYLNDNLIDFYLKWLRLFGGIDEEMINQSYFFNSFFFNKFCNLKSNTERSSILKWTNQNIFNFKYLFIPINSKFHWSLVVVCNPGEVEPKPKRPNSLEYNPCILHLCSLYKPNTHIFAKIRCYLEFLYETEKGKKMKFTKDRIPGFRPHVPRQANGYDCGLFLLHYAEKFCRNPPKIFIKEQLDLDLNRWFPLEEINEKRESIKNLIFRLKLEQCANDEDGDEGLDEDAENKVDNEDEDKDENKIEEATQAATKQNEAPQVENNEVGPSVKEREENQDEETKKEEDMNKPGKKQTEKKKEHNEETKAKELKKDATKQSDTKEADKANEKKGKSDEIVNYEIIDDVEVVKAAVQVEEVDLLLNKFPSVAPIVDSRMDVSYLCVDVHVNNFTKERKRNYMEIDEHPLKIDITDVQTDEQSVELMETDDVDKNSRRDTVVIVKEKREAASPVEPKKASILIVVSQ